MLTSRTYAIRGGAIAFTLSVISGILLPITFLACATDSTLRSDLLVPVCVAVILVKALFAVPIGAWLGWHVGEKKKSDPTFLFWTHCRNLAAGFLRQRAYRAILAVITLLTAIKFGFWLYYRFSNRSG